MDFLFKDKQGNKCAAKTYFLLIMLVFVVDVAYSRYASLTVDFSGWSIVMGVVGGLYGWRSQTKSS